MEKRRGTKQNKRKTKQKIFFKILFVLFFFCYVPRRDQFAAGSSILCYLFPQSFTGLFIVMVLLSSLKKIMSFKVPRKP